MYEATQFAIADCMKSRGFTYLPVPYASSNSSSGQWGDVQQAEKVGYGFNFSGAADGAVGDETRVADPNDETVAAMSASARAAWTAALNGSVGGPDSVTGSDVVQVVDSQGGVTSYSKSSCRTFGSEQVQGDLAAWIKSRQRLEDLAGEVAQRTDSDPRIAESMRKWSECMKGRGYSVVTRDQAQSYIAEKVQAGELTAIAGRQQEINVAVADAECAHSTGALETRRQVVAEYEKAVRDQNENDFLAFQELQQQASRRAMSRVKGQ